MVQTYPQLLLVFWPNILFLSSLFLLRYMYFCFWQYTRMRVNDKAIQRLLEEKHQKQKAYLSDTSSVSSKTAYSNIHKTVQARLRDMQDSWLSKKADEIQSFADRKDIGRSCLMHFRQFVAPRAQEPLHFSESKLTKKLSRKAGLNTLMVSLIGHHLSVMKLSTDYHRWNVICCLISFQPSLKQWKQ